MNPPTRHCHFETPTTSHSSSSHLGARTVDYPTAGRRIPTTGSEHSAVSPLTTKLPLGRVNLAPALYPSSSHLSDHDGHIVAASTGNGAFDQLIDDCCHVFCSRQCAPYHFVGELGEQTVTAECDPVSHFD